LENWSPETVSEPEKPRTNLTKLIGLAVIAGALAGAAALYVNGGAPVHGGQQSATVEQASACPANPVAKEEIGKAATGDVAAMLPSDPPKPLAALGFNGPDGKPLSVGDFKGRTVLLNLWATWCVPCREEMPALDALQAKAGDAAFEVVAVNVDAGDDQGKRQRFLTETGIKSLKDYAEPSMSLFNATKREGLALGLPVTLLIGKDGCLLAAMNGPANWAGADALKLIETAKGL
jgi:thiol-disulfide isomerase/thioredoxin